MATKNKPLNPVIAGPDPVTSDLARQSMPPTPENTPVPGGGRWRWDITAPGWVDVDAAPTDALPTANPANPIQPE